jgi:hypothetical protein
MRSVHELSDAELREELERTRAAYAEYVEDVGEHPSHASRDLGDDARRHLDVREELDRRAGGYHHDELPGTPARAGGDADAGGQAGAGHVDPGELAASQAVSYADDPDRGTARDSDVAAVAGSQPAAQHGGVRADGSGSSQGEVPAPAPADDREDPRHEDLAEKLDPGDVEPYA